MTITFRCSIQLKDSHVNAAALNVGVLLGGNRKELIRYCRSSICSYLRTGIVMVLIYIGARPRYWIKVTAETELAKEET